MKPIVSANTNELRDTFQGMIRTEVRSTPATAISVKSSRMARLIAVTYTIASLRFIHRDDMESGGYGKYLDQFEEV